MRLAEPNATVTLLDPTGVVRPRAGALAPRLDTLRGKTMGIVDDGLMNSRVLLGALADELERQYCAKSTPPVVKSSVSSPVASATFAELLRDVDFVLVGVGLCGGCSSYCVHDAVEFENAGKPAVAIVQDVFASLAEAKKQRVIVQK